MQVHRPDGFGDRMYVEVRFVKATPNAITLDLHVPPHFELEAGAPKAERFELQWREAKNEGEWATASSSLKLRRCTKGNLKHGYSYIFRARAFAGVLGWTDYGPETDPLFTTLPEVPEGCSESLKVPALVSAAASQQAAAKAEANARVTARKEAQLIDFVERKASAAKAMQVAVAELSRQQDSLRVSILKSLEDVRRKAENEFEEARGRVQPKSNEEIAEEMDIAVATAATEMAEQADREQMSLAGTQAMIESAKARARKKTIIASEQKLATELGQIMADIEMRVAPNVLQALKSARVTAETYGMHNRAASSQTIVRHAVEAASLEAVHEYRLDLQYATKQLEERLAVEHGGYAHDEAEALTGLGKDVLEYSERMRARCRMSLLARMQHTMRKALAEAEERALQRQESAVAESWLLVETLRAREASEARLGACEGIRKSQLETRQRQLASLQALLNSGRECSQDQQALLSADATAAQRAAAEAHKEAEYWRRRIADAGPWQLERIYHEQGRTADAAADDSDDPDDEHKVLPPPAFIGAIPKEDLRAAMDRAADAARGLSSHVGGGETAVRLLVDKAIETMVEEATHLEKLRQRYAMRERLSELRAEKESLALQVPKAKRAAVEAAAAAAAKSEAAATSAVAGTVIVPLVTERQGRVVRLDDDDDDNTDGLIGETNVSSVLSKALQQLAEAAASASASASAGGGGDAIAQGMVDEARIVGEAQREILAAASAAQLQAVTTARQEWERMHLKEMEHQKERMHLALHQALEESQDYRQERVQEAVDRAVTQAEDRLERQHAASITQAMKAERTRLEDQWKEKLALAVAEAKKEATEKALASKAVALQAATLDKAKKLAYEQARQDLAEELQQAERTKGEALLQAENALMQLEEVKRGTSKAALQAVALAAPVQRQAAEAAVRAAVAAERQKNEITKQLAVEQALNEAHKAAAEAEAAAVAKAVEETKAKGLKSTKYAVDTAVAKARLDERQLAAAAARGELKRQLDVAAARAGAEQKRAIAAALEAAERKRSAAVVPDAVRAVRNESELRAREVKNEAAELTRRALAEREERFERDKKAAVAAAVEEVVRVRKRAEERLVAGARTATSTEVAREWEARLSKEVSLAERRGAAREAEYTAEKVRQAVEDAVSHTMSRIKPALQRQEEVERAIKQAEERARETERLRAAETQKRIEKLASEASMQPMAVQTQIRAAVRAAEERFETQLGQVHETYKKAANEQQLQIRELLRQAHEHARQQQELAVEKAIDEVRAACEEEKSAAMEAAKAAVQMSALQQAEELDKVMVEVAELRAENRVQHERLQEVSLELARAHRQLGLNASCGASAAAAAQEEADEAREEADELMRLRRAAPALPSGHADDPFDQPVVRLDADGLRTRPRPIAAAPAAPTGPEPGDELNDVFENATTVSCTVVMTPDE